MYKIAVMGDMDSIYGFAALGLDLFPMEDPADAGKKLREKIEAEIDRYKESDLPAIILIPGVSGNTGRGIMAVKKSVERAVGTDIIFNNQATRR